MEFSTAPYILRALVKDKEVVENYVTDPLATLVTETFSARTSNRYDKHIEVVSRSMYMFFSLFAGQTLGEELCSLLAVSRSAVFWRPISIYRKLFLSLLYGMEKPAVLWVSRKCFPRRPSEDILEVTDRAVLCLLMLFETYGTLSHRLLRIRYISLRQPRELRSGSGARYGYLIPGIVLAISLLVGLCRFFRSWRSAKAEGIENGAASDTSSSDREESESDEGRDFCILCFSKKRAPSSVPCGHVFCWRCITEAVKKDSRCPLCRESVSLSSIVPLFFSQPSSPSKVAQER